MRRVINLNRGWYFLQKDMDPPAELPTGWQQVDLPHTWNAVDGMDGNGGYDRGSYWYARSFPTPQQPVGTGRVYVEVLAAGQQATLYVNGEKAGSHEGGYSIFRADVTELCRRDRGENLLLIHCSNEERDTVYPQQADFTFYGGLYRGANLISVPETHFDLDYYGGSGLMVTPKPTGDGGAAFAIRSFLTNPDENFTVLYEITDGEGREVAGGCRPADSPDITLYVPDARLWSTDTPYLYTVHAILQRRNEACDEVEAKVGVRSFSVDPNQGFILNGVPTPLRGVSRHQDRLYQGNALSREDHYEDAKIIKEMGANTIRLAHYEHSQDFYDACDELGFIVWAEIPFISVFNGNPDAHQNCITQLKELIVQNYNHPSICFWGLSNEILIGEFSDQLVECHKELNSIAKTLDPTRLTTLAHLTTTSIQSPMHHITDVISYNHYFGWYGHKLEDNGPWLDEFRKVNPDVCLGMSEYGCEGILTYHSSKPACKDYSEEYQALYHEHMAQVFAERPWVWSSYVWNMFDFGSAIRNEGGVGGRNNKGLVTIDRKTKKDSYYVYQAYWSKTPMVRIAGRRYAQRAGDTTDVKVYTNQQSIALYLNGACVGRQSGSRVCTFTVALAAGNNILVADAGSVKDSISLEKVDVEPSIYTLPGVNDRNEGVANWFSALEGVSLDTPMEFPEGRYSVRFTLEQLAACTEAFGIVSEALQLITGFELAPGTSTWDMVKQVTPEEMATMSGDMMPKGFLEGLNAQLTKIDIVK